MVFKRRQEYGFNGFQVPFIPRGPRSVRRRGISKKADQDGQICAIEVLASLAGKLLQESESSASSNASEGNHQQASGRGAAEQESQCEAKVLATEGVHHGSCAESTFMTEVVSRNSRQKYLGQTETDAVLECTSVTNPADCYKKTEPDIKSEICKREDQVEHYSSRLAEAPQNFGELCNNGNINNGFKREQEAGSSGIEGPSLADKCSLKDPLGLRVNSCAVINSDGKVKSPFCKGTFHSSSFSRYGNDSKLGFRDDDENFIRCSKISTKPRALKPSQRIAHRRIRKLMTSKYWKAAPKLKDCELSRSDVGVKPLFQKRKACHSFERGQYDTLFKRKKFSNRASGLTFDGGFSSESVSNSLEKGTGGDNPSSFSKQHESRDSHVKFSIKSFKIPELYIEVPETTTVGSLKRTVMEAVMAILGGEVHVGVLLQGKKVRDDNRTLLQTGLSCEENIGNLGFSLESSSLQGSPPSVCIGDPSSHYEPSHSTRSPRTPVLDSGISDVIHDSPLLTNMGNLIESNHESISSPTDTMTDKIAPDSRSLVAVPDRSMEPLAMVPVNQTTKRSELVQRRTRRPFSVSEVEALVQAVEELGTGRWRDVKLLAFENADHRTYVDLKDKWKTLVHTARISPQQRRGEPVPQELLDRVLAAHAFWSQHQAKQQHGKHHQSPAATSKVKESSAPQSQSLTVGGEGGSIIQPIGTM